MSGLQVGDVQLLICGRLIVRDDDLLLPKMETVFHELHGFICFVGITPVRGICFRSSQTAETAIYCTYSGTFRRGSDVLHFQHEGTTMPQTSMLTRIRKQFPKNIEIRHHSNAVFVAEKV